MSEKKCSPLAAVVFGFLLGAIAMKLVERFCPMYGCCSGETCCCGEGEGEGEGCCGSGDGEPCCCQEPEPETDSAE